MDDLRNQISLLSLQYLELCVLLSRLESVLVEPEEMREIVETFDLVEKELKQMLTQYKNLCQVNNYPINLTFERLLNKISEKI